MNISGYDFGSLCVGDRRYDSDVIVFPDRVQDRWRRRHGHRLEMADLTSVIRASPRVLIVGTGYYGRMEVAEDTRTQLAGRGVELHVAPTPDAVSLYNTMRKSAGVVAALHLSC